MEHVRNIGKTLSLRRTSSANRNAVGAAKCHSSEPPPQLSLSNVETRLNMHQYNGLFEPDKQNGAMTEDAINAVNRAGSPPPPNGAGNGEPASAEWSSAVGHAMTGKSGRVIHNLQEDIARLTRELALQRSRAEEAQRSNEALKQQLLNVTDRLRNAEQSNEANLNSIARKDRKIEDLKAEVQREKKRRLKAEDDARRTDQLAAKERDEHHKGLAEAQEIASHARSQYDTVARTRSREQAEYKTRFDKFRRELDALFEREEERQHQLKRFDVIIEQKNRELEAGKERMERYEELFREYKEQSDRTVRELVQGGKRNNEDIEKVLVDVRGVTDKMKWVMNLKRKETGDS